MTDHLFMERQPDTDIAKHLESLKARLGFAKFKLRNGWEKNTLLDVESFWRERQRQLVENLPTPRFKQRDILDNKTLHPHYHYSKNGLLSSPTFTHRQHQRRHSHQDRKKRRIDRLTRSHSTPTTSESPAPLSQQGQQEYDLSSTTSSCTPSPPPTANRTTQHLDLYEEDDAGDDTEDDDCHYTYSLNKRTRTITPPSPPFNTNDPHHYHKKQAIIIQPKRGKSSLDYLSYAIAMTENQAIRRQHQSASQSQLNADNHYGHYEHNEEMNDCNVPKEDDEFHDARSSPFVAPPSPVTAAAEAMMMFGHHSH